MEKLGAITKEDMQERHEAEKALALKTSPALNGQIKVQIDSRTWIYIDSNKDPKEARDKFLRLYGQG